MFVVDALATAVFVFTTALDMNKTKNGFGTMLQYSQYNGASHCAYLIKFTVAQIDDIHWRAESIIVFHYPRYQML